jgi:hypothetical protein
MGLAAGHRALVGCGKRDCPGRELGVRDREVGCLGLGGIVRGVYIVCSVLLLVEGGVNSSRRVEKSAPGRPHWSGDAPLYLDRASLPEMTTHRTMKESR